MKSYTVFLLFVLGAFSAHASSVHGRFSYLDYHHHRGLIRRQSDPEPSVSPKTRRSQSARCKTSPILNLAAPASSSSSPAAASQASVVSPKGLISVTSNCGPTGATEKVTAVSGPNGNIDWLNCGINDGGWRPPFIRVTDIITADLPTAIKDSQSPFQACTNFVSLFEKYGSKFGVPSILLASFAMQESSCNPHTVGGAGEQGLMQITKDKCTQAPGGNCQDPEYNIMTGAKFFSDTLNNNGGDLLKTIGEYNGWPDGLTFGQATAAAYTNCCLCQNNLDYLHQFLNGWCQNINAYGTDPRLGKYFNLDVCHK